MIETVHGPGYTFEDIGQKMSVDHSTALAYNRNAARTAKAWESKTGTPAPIGFSLLTYETVDDDLGAQRSTLSLLPGLAERILDLPYPG